MAIATWRVDCNESCTNELDELRETRQEVSGDATLQEGRAARVDRHGRLRGSSRHTLDYRLGSPAIPLLASWLHTPRFHHQTEDS